MVLMDLPSEVLRATLDFIYGVTPQTTDDFERLLDGARHFGIPGASDYCNRHLKEFRDVVGGRGYNILKSDDKDHNTPQQVEDQIYTPETSRPHDNVTLPSLWNVSSTSTHVDGDNLDNNTVIDYYDIRSQDLLHEGQTWMTSSDVSASTCHQESLSTTCSGSVTTTVPSNSPQMSLESRHPITTADIVSRRCQGMTPPNDVVHDSLMTRMSLGDLARPIECPHLKRMIEGGLNESYDFELSNPLDSENPDALTIDTDSDIEDDQTEIETVEKVPPLLEPRSSTIKSMNIGTPHGVVSTIFFPEHTDQSSSSQFTSMENGNIQTFRGEIEGIHVSSNHAFESLRDNSLVLTNVGLNTMYSNTRLHLTQLDRVSLVPCVTDLGSLQSSDSTISHKDRVTNSVTVRSSSATTHFQNISFPSLSPLSTASVSPIQNIISSSVTEAGRLFPNWPNIVSASTNQIQNRLDVASTKHSFVNYLLTNRREDTVASDCPVIEPVVLYKLRTMSTSPDVDLQGNSIYTNTVLVQPYCTSSASQIMQPGRESEDRTPATDIYDVGHNEHEKFVV